MGLIGRMLGRLAGPTDLGPGISESRMLEGDWASVERELLDNPRIRGLMQKLDRDVGHLAPGLSLAKLPTVSARESINVLVTDIATVYGAAAAATLNVRDAVVLNLDDPLAEAQVTDQGAALIVLSSGLVTACTLSATAAHVLGEAREEAAAHSTSAVLRFYHLQQAYFGLSAVHGLLRPSRSSWTRAAELSTLFVLSHELAHHVLGHARTASDSWSAQRELEADQWAGELLLRGPGCRILARGNEENALKGIQIALNTLHCRERAAFVRTPGTHPQEGERWKAATRGWAGADEVFQTGLQIRGLAYAAADLDEPLSASRWAALRASRVWNTSMREPSVYATAEVLDRLSGTPQASLLDVLTGMPDAFPDSPGVHLERALHQAFSTPQPLEAALSECGVASKDVTRICSPAAVLTRGGVRNSFERSNLWPEATPPPERAITCAIAVTLTLQALKERSSP